MNRTREQWAAVCPKTVAKTASPAAVMYLVDDALSDIARLHRQADQLRAEVEALRKGAARYEAVRKLDPRQFTELWTAGLRGDRLFDDGVDDLIAALAAKEGE